MLEYTLTKKAWTSRQKIACKTLVSGGLIALAVALPQMVHIALGQPGGVQWLPMYLPILIGGCLLGTRWAVGVALLSPMMSFVLTSAMGSPMPAAARLPFMMAELAVFALVSGLFSEKIVRNGLWAIPAVLLAQAAGRGTFLGLVYLLQSFVPFDPAMIAQQIQAGLPGIVAQWVLVPVVILLLRKPLLKGDAHE